MLPIFLVLSATALLLLLIYHYVVFPAFFSPLSRIPNAHFTSPIVPTWIWWKRRAGAEVRSIFSAHQKLGPIVRLGPKELSVASQDGLRQIYLGGFDKDRWYIDAFQNYETPNLVSMLQHKPHSIQKRMLSHVYSKSYLQNSADMRTLSGTLLVERLLPVLHSAAENDTPVNVLELAQATGMDFMSAYLFGTANSTDFIRDVPARQEYLSFYRTKARGLPGKDKATRAIESRCLSMCQSAESWVRDSYERPSTPTPSTNPVVYSKLSSSLTKSPAQATKPTTVAVASEMFDHLLAGHETSGITLTYLMYELSGRPELQSSLRTELLTLSPSLIYPSVSQSTLMERQPRKWDLPHPNQIDTLPLLNAIVYETLRLYTATPGPQPRVTPAGTTIEGFPNIPAGVRISTSAYCMHRNEEAFPDASAFKPERWMQGEKKGSGGTEEMRRWFWAFGSGGRMCLGSNFALQGMCVLLAH